MAVAANVILMYLGTNSSIPAGWSRETALDGFYLKGAAAGIDPGSTGGAATHTHTVDAHTHSQNSHTHSFTLSGGATSLTYSGSSAAPSHGHYFNASHSASNVNASITLDEASNEPAYRSVIFIKSAGTDNIPSGVIGMYKSVTVPADWLLCDGTNGTSDMNAVFIKGALTDGDGNITGGSATHSHTNVAHSHSQSSHGSGSATSSVVSRSRGGIPSTYDPSNLTSRAGTHSHSVSISNASGSTASDSITMSSSSVDIIRKAIAFIQSQAELSSYLGVIGIWTGSIASIPATWALCDGTNDTPDMRGFFVVGTISADEVGVAYGTGSHTHIADSHTHLSNGHSHSGSSGGPSSSATVYPGVSQYAATSGHTHGVSCSSAAPDNGGTVVTINATGSVEPQYYEVVFIKNITDEVAPVPDAAKLTQPMFYNDSIAVA